MEGASLGTWASRWWQWAKNPAVGKDPVLDETGAFASVGQDYRFPVWFLAGSYYTTPIKRKCEVPEGRPLFFPIINTLGGACFSSPTFDCLQLRMEARNDMAKVQKIYFKLDGESLENPEKYYEESPDCFQVKSNNPKKGFAAGFWVMLKPLPAGQHVLQFGADAPGFFSQNIEYLITVKPAGTLSVGLGKN